jgi:RNA polymerase-binding transcription factor
VADNSKLLRSALESEKGRLNKELVLLEPVVNLERREGSPFGKREEEAAESTELEKRLAMERRVKHQLSEVDRALAKFDEKTYGVCDKCGKNIGKERLEALPWATLCLTCKAERAKNVGNNVGAR